MSQRLYLEKEGKARDGGPWCNTCHGWTEVNTDREMNVCGRCGRPSVVIRPGLAQALDRQRVKWEGHWLSAQEVHEKFEELRRSLEGPGTTTNGHELTRMERDPMIGSERITKQPKGNGI